MLAPNSLLKDRYRILHRIGGGGFGEVYKAIDEVFGCAVAIKETKERVSGHDQLRKAFEREAKLLRNLSHECLPRVSDYFFVEQAQYLVMDYIEGEDLFVRLKKRINHEGPFTVAEVLPWADKVLSALEYLHTRPNPIIHRDIKPLNIILTETGEIFLLDFGFAKGLAGQMSTLLEGQSLLSLAGFTHEYAPLEQLQGTGTEVQSDIYAFGATLYHLLTGHIPISASKRDEVMHREHRDPLPMAHQVNPAIPQVISEIISQAMIIRSWDRLASAKEMRSLLTEAGQDNGSQSEKSDSVAKVGSSARRWIVAGMSVVLVIVLATGARALLLQWFTNSKIQIPATEAKQSIVATKPPVPMTPRNLKPSLLRPAHRGTVWSVAYSPDGKYVASAGDDKKILLWKTDNLNESGIELSGHEGPVYSVAFSPDSKTLASASEDGSIKLWVTTRNGRDTALPIDGNKWPVLRLAFSPNGEYLASCASKDITNGCEEIRIWEVRQNWSYKPLVGILSRVHAIAFSPDSMTLVTVGLDKQMRLWDSRTGQEKDSKTLDQELLSMSFFSGNGYLALGAGDGTIRLWRYDSSGTNSAKSLRLVATNPKDLLNVVVAASPDNKTLASAVPSQEIKLWDIDSESPTSLSGHEAGTSQTALAFSPDGQALISGDYRKGLVRVWH